jgi:photosystem II stability/assembly factor-like uncharacterized protein
MKSLSTLLAILLFSSFGFSQLEPTGFIPGFGFSPNVYANENVVLASINSRLFRSEDNGMNWYQVTEGIGPGMFNSRKISEVDGILLLSTGARERLYRSTDNGASWEPANSGIEDPLTVQGVYAMSSSEGNIFIGNQYMLKRSTDQGLTWEDTELSNNCTAIAELDGEIWVAQQSQVHYSTDNGDSWGTINADPHTHEAASVSCFAMQGDRIFAGVTYDDLSALKYTEDHGTTWDTLGAFNQVQDIIVDSSGLYLRSLNGIYHSTNNGHNWTLLQELPFTPFDMSLNGNDLWVATISGPKRLDLATSDVLAPEISLGNVQEIVNIDETLFCLANNNLYRSTNNGDSWDNIMQNVAIMNQQLYRLQTNGSTLLVSENGQDEFAAVSQNNGDTFDEIPLTPHGTAAHLMTGDRLISFSFIDYTFWYSDDLGENWDSATKFPSSITTGFNTFETLKRFGDILIAGFTGGVAVSVNNGEHWNFHDHPESIFVSIEGWQDKLIAIVEDDQTGDRTIQKSTDYGESWSDAISGFAPQNDQPAPVKLIRLEDRIYCTNSTSPYDEDSGKIYARNQSGNWFEVPELGVPPMEVVCMTQTTTGNFAGLRNFGVWYTQDVAFGINEENQSISSISLYPNPSSEYIQVESDQTGQYQIREMGGRIVQFGVTKSEKETIDIGSLSSGVYFFTILGDQSISTKRFVVD